MSLPTKAGLYIHIPFCRHRCGYCAFAISTKNSGDRSVQADYLNAIYKEWDMRQSKHGPFEFETLYVGGGTPSRLHPELILQFGQWIAGQDSIKAQKSTFEINPEDVMDENELPHAVMESGFNRISFGIQTLSPIGLKSLDRLTDPDDTQLALERLPFQPEQMSFDFILGWPGQTLSDVVRDLAFIKDFRPGHISAYILNDEPGTRLTKLKAKDPSLRVSDDAVSELWNLFREELISSGYNNYEISSFALPSKESEHNRSTWRGLPYLGLGSGAVSRLGKTRWTNQGIPSQYVEMIHEGRWPVAQAEFTGGDIAWQEALLLGCRHSEGLSLKVLQSFFSEEIPRAFLESWKRGILSKDLVMSEDHLKFTPEGWARFDAWISDWMLILESLKIR